jgi:hypothetical protein
VLVLLLGDLSLFVWGLHWIFPSKNLKIESVKPGHRERGRRESKQRDLKTREMNRAEFERNKSIIPFQIFKFPWKSMKILNLFVCFSFRRARVCWPFLCLCRD